MKFEKKNEKEPRKEKILRWKSPRTITIKRAGNSLKDDIPTGRQLTKLSQKMRLKNEKGKNHAPVAPLGTTRGENVENRS